MLSTLPLAVLPSLTLALTLTASLVVVMVISTSVVFDLLVEIIKRRPAEPRHILKRRHVAMLQHGLDVLHSTIRLPEIVLPLADVLRIVENLNQFENEVFFCNLTTSRATVTSASKVTANAFILYVDCLKYGNQLSERSSKLCVTFAHQKPPFYKCLNTTWLTGTGDSET